MSKPRISLDLWAVLLSLTLALVVRIGGDDLDALFELPGLRILEMQRRDVGFDLVERRTRRPTNRC